MGEEKKKKGGILKEVSRRDFMVKGGKYALVTGAAMQVLLTSKRAMAQSGRARFRINVGGHTARLRTVNNAVVLQPFNPETAHSPTTTWHCSAGGAYYNSYEIKFEGDTGALPNNVSVTIHWQATKNFGPFKWGCTNFGDSGTEIVDIHKTGGRVGQGFGPCTLKVPFVLINNPKQPANGTVKFTAPGVDPLTITVVYTPNNAS